MKRRKFYIMTAASACLIVLAVAVVAFHVGAVVSAQEETIVERTAVSGTTATLLQYQGWLSDPSSGEAVEDGNYTMALRLYGKPTGGSPLWSEVQDVPVRDGLFSTVLGDTTKLDQSLFNGRELWLGIKVQSDAEAAPRQQVLPVAYALGLVPGAAVQDLVVDGDLTVNGSLNGGTHGHSDLVTHYELDDHIYGGLHNGRAIAYGSINQHGEVYSASGNVSSEWRSDWKCYMITIDGHTYDQRYYVTTVTSISGFANAWGLEGNLCVDIHHPDGTQLQRDFHFVTFKP